MGRYKYYADRQRPVRQVRQVAFTCDRCGKRIGQQEALAHGLVDGQAVCKQCRKAAERAAASPN